MSAGAQIPSIQTQQSGRPRPSGTASLTPARALGRFLLAAVYFLLARAVAARGAQGLVPEDWVSLTAQAMLVFLLLFGYAGLGFVLDGELHPVEQQGLSRRAGWLGEAGLGVAVGWGIAVFCVLPMVVFGGIAVHLSLSFSAFGWLFVEAAYFALAALAAQIAFRGYPFQCAMRVIGELPAALMLAVLYGILQAALPGAGRASMAVNVAFGLLLAMAYLRTRALWLPWGLQFGWVASRALLFGLPIEGVSGHSPVVQGVPMSPAVFNGGDFGLDGTWLAFAAMLLAMPFVYRATRELSFRHNAPVLVPGGIAVDMDAAARRQHDAATRPEAPEVKPLVQILPVASAVPMPLARDLERDQERPGGNPYDRPLDRDPK